MNKDKAYAAAVRLLSVSDKTEAELTERLVSKGFSEEDAAGAAGRLVSRGYLNEKLHAERTVMRLFDAHYGPGYIKAYLENKRFGAPALETAEKIMSELDFDASAKEYYAGLISSGKTRAQASAALYRRGFEE